MKAREFSSALATFSETAARLNQQSDSVNSILSTIQQRLVAANVGVEVWLRRALTSTDAEAVAGERMWTSQFIGFAKIENQWCLAVKSTRFATGFFEGDTNCPYQEEYAAGKPARLLDASRPVRIEALRYLPELIELLTEEAQGYINTIDEAKGLVQ